MMGTWESLTRTLILALLTTGGATFVWTAFRSIIAWRDSAEGREDKAIARLEAYERDCREQLACERRMGQYWYAWAGQLEYEMRKAGMPVPERPPEPMKWRSEPMK